MTNITRTREGCWTCRERRVKCDENRPICRRCAKSEISCSYGIRLVWEEESSIKGVCHGRAGIWSKKRDGKRMARRGQRQQDEILQLKRQDSRSLQPSGWNNGQEKQHYRTQSRPTFFLNTTVEDLQVYFAYNEDALVDGERRPAGIGRIETGGSEADLLSLRRSLSFGPALFQSLPGDGYLLAYYETIICPSSTLLDDVYNNPYRHLILPMAMQSEGLYHATLAISANTLRLAEPKYAMTALVHRQKALEALIRILKQGKWSEQEIDEALGLALMLCWFEISDGSRPSWVAHLSGLWKLLTRRQQSASTLSLHSENLYCFFRRYFAFHLVLARTAFRVDDDVHFPNFASSITRLPHTPPGDGETPFMENPSISTSKVLKLPPLYRYSRTTEFLFNNMSSDQLDSIDPYMGFSNSLLLLINEVAELAWEDYPLDSTRNSAADLKARVCHLKQSLESLQQTPPFSNPIPNSDANGAMGFSVQQFSELEFTTIAEANRLAALLLLHEICSPSSKHSGTTTKSRSSHCLPNLPAEDKQRYVRDILQLLSQNLMSVIRSAATPLWPVFLAGCCATEEKERVTVLNIFELSEGLKRFGNITPARKVVEMVWRQRDLAVQDDRKRRKAHSKNSSSIAKSASLPFVTPLGESHHSRVIQNNEGSRNTRKRIKRFEWEGAMAMLGGWKLSLT